METPRDRAAVDVSLLLIRLIAGGTMMAHGAQKLFGAFGGPGLDAVVNGAGGKPGMGALGYLVTVGEFFGGLGLILGVLTRFSAAANLVIMVGAILTVHGKNGFFAQGGGFEYNLALIALFAAILIAGPGRYTIVRPLPFLGRTGDPPHVAIE